MDDRKLATTLGDVVRARRKALGVSQEEVAEKVGIASQFYGRIERGIALPSVPTLSNLADALGLSTDELLGRSKSIEPPPEPRDSPDVHRVVRAVRRASKRDLRLVGLLLGALASRSK